MLTPMSSCACAPSFKSVAPKICLNKVPFVAIFLPDRNKKLVWSYTCTQNVPQILLIPNIYGFMVQLPRFKCLC